jgi:hypothetical protein
MLTTDTRSGAWQPRAFSLAANLTLLALVGPLMASASLVAEASTDRAVLLELRREAADWLERAGRSDAPRDDVQRGRAEAAQRFVALGAEPNEEADSPLSPELRAELRRAAAALSSVEAADPERTSQFDPGAYLRLLDDVRSQLDEGIALGLSLQGSFSRSKVEEPTYGGHASAMGPAPAQVSSADDSAAGAPSSVRFEEATSLPGRSYCGGPMKDHVLESGGSGVALLDYDGDGRLDIYLVTAAEITANRDERIPHRNVLYRNLGNWNFEDVSSQAGVDAAAWGNGVCTADFDDDGLIDIYVTNWGPNMLFRNQGDGTFIELAARAGVAAGGWSTGCAFLDADGDGDLDLYVARYVEVAWNEVLAAERNLTWRDGPRIMVGPVGLPGEGDLFFENIGSGRFEEATEAHGLSDPERAYGFGVVATDYDNDGWVDLYVANDSNPNFLYHNRGDGTFESVGALSGVALDPEGRAQAGMGVDSGDFDGDGRLDLVTTNFAHDTNALSHNLDGFLFEDATSTFGIAARTFHRMGWGVAFLDADLDGRLDLFFANGHIFADVEDFADLGETYGQKNQLLWNGGTGFRDISESAGGGLQVQKVSRGLAVGDLDNDGDPDLVVSNVDDVLTLLENRQSTGHHWITLRVTAPGPNRFAIGARVTLEGGGRRQVREVRSGGGFLSQNDLRAHFGLGDHASPVNVVIRMPGGRQWRWSNLATDRLHVLTLSEASFIADSSPEPR